MATEILNLNGVDFTCEEIAAMPVGWIEKDGKRFYRGNIFDTPQDHDGRMHKYVEAGGARLFAFAPVLDAASAWIDSYASNPD